MTREEEIKKEALFNCNDIAGEVDYKSTAAYEGFIRGAEWADKTMLDHACEWLLDNSRNYFEASGGHTWINYWKLADDFKKAMKGE